MMDRVSNCGRGLAQSETKSANVKTNPPALEHSQYGFVTLEELDAELNDSSFEIITSEDEFDASEYQVIKIEDEVKPNLVAEFEQSQFQVLDEEEVGKIKVMQQPSSSGVVNSKPSSLNHLQTMQELHANDKYVAQSLIAQAFRKQQQIIQAKRNHQDNSDVVSLSYKGRGYKISANGVGYVMPAKIRPNQKVKEKGIFKGVIAKDQHSLVLKTVGPKYQFNLTLNEIEKLLMSLQIYSFKPMLEYQDDLFVTRNGGTPLAELIQAQQVVDFAAWKPLIKDLQKLHNHLIFHRDIKPANLTLKQEKSSTTGQPKPLMYAIDLDFMLAYAELKESEKLMRAGTPGYVPKFYPNPQDWAEVYDKYDTTEYLGLVDQHAMVLCILQSQAIYEHSLELAKELAVRGSVDSLKNNPQVMEFISHWVKSDYQQLFANFLFSPLDFVQPTAFAKLPHIAEMFKI